MLNSGVPINTEKKILNQIEFFKLSQTIFVNIILKTIKSQNTCIEL